MIKRLIFLILCGSALFGVAFLADRNYIEPMLFGVAFMVVVFFCLRWAIVALKGFSSSQFAGSNSVHYGSSGLNAIWELQLHPLVGRFVAGFSFFSLSIFLATSQMRNLSLFRLPVFLVGSFMSKFTVRCLSILIHSRKVALFTPTIMSVLAKSGPVELRKVFNLLAFRTLLCYDQLRHVFFLIKKSCLEPISSYTLGLGLFHYTSIKSHLKLILFFFLFTSITSAYNPSITSFNAGAVSPLMEARSDFQKYSSSSRTIENMFVTVQGPVLKRPGTKYIATAKSGSPRLLPFEFSTDDAYVLETGNLYMRFYRNGGQILSGATPFEIVTTYATADLFNIKHAQADNDMYLADGSNKPQILTRADHDDWTIADVDYANGPFLPENETTTTITPSGTTGSITLTASAAIFQSASGASHVGSLWAINQTRDNSTITGSFSANGTSLSTPSFTGSYGFTTSGNTGGTITLQRSTNNGTSWRSALTALTNTDFDNPAETEDDVAIYRVVMSNYASGTPTFTFTITDDTNKGVVEITAVASTTSATATVITDLVSTSATTKWREGYWSDFRGWPTSVAFHQQRLVYGGSRSFPQALWFGKQNPDDYANFLEGTLDTSAFTAELPGQNPIRWILSQDYLLIGTSGSVGKYGEQGKSVTPTSPNYQEQTRHGSDNLSAILGGDSVLYIERGARKVREFGFSFQVDKYLSPDLTLLSPEITETGITDIAFQLRPVPILWNVLADGDIATLTYQRDQSVVAWTKQNTDGDFDSVTVISGDDEDEVWVSVDRGGSANFIEQFQPQDWGTDQEDAWFVDSGLGYDSTPATTFSGLDHLNGDTVAVWADGTVQDSEVVASGSITLDVESSVVAAGLPFTAKLETLPIRADPQDMTLNKKIKRLWVDFYKTGDVSFGNGANSDLTEVNFTQGSSFVAFQDLFTSTVKLKQFSFVYGGMIKQTIYFESSKPSPLGIRAIVPEMEIRR